MNPKVLQKCLEELKKESPNIQYVLGMLETIIEMMPDITIGPSVSFINKDKNETKTSIIRSENSSDEEIIPDFLRPGPTGNISN